MDITDEPSHLEFGIKQATGKRFKFVANVASFHEQTERIFHLKFTVNVFCHCDTCTCLLSHVVMFNMLLLLLKIFTSGGS